MFVCAVMCRCLRACVRVYAREMLRENDRDARFCVPLRVKIYAFVCACHTWQQLCMCGANNHGIPVSFPIPAHCREPESRTGTREREGNAWPPLGNPSPSRSFDLLVQSMPLSAI